MDEEQNWELLEAREENGKTFLRFKRPFDTCDEDDIQITVRFMTQFSLHPSLVVT